MSTNYNKNWREYSEIRISKTDTGDGVSFDKIVEPIERFTKRKLRRKKVIHSLNRANAGKIHEYPLYFWTMTVRANSEALVYLHQVDDVNGDFDIHVAAAEDQANGIYADGNVYKAWSLNDCSVEDISDVYVINDTPVVTVSGIAMGETKTHPTVD